MRTTALNSRAEAATLRQAGNLESQAIDDDAMRMFGRAESMPA